MNDLQSSSDDHCAAIVDALIARHGWALVDRDTLLARALADLRMAPGADLRYIVLGAYNHALYRACQGAEGRRLWERAYEELHRMLYQKARWRAPEICEDAAQEALVLICAGLERCREPRAFYSFALQKLQIAIRRIRLRAAQPLLSLDRAIGDDEAPLADTLAAANEDVEMLLADAELAEEVAALLGQIERERPQARRQIVAVRLKYIDGLDDETIAALLGLSVKSLHEARSRGLSKLREDGRFHRLRGTI